MSIKLTKEQVAQEIARTGTFENVTELSDGRWDVHDMMDHMKYWLRRGRDYNSISLEGQEVTVIEKTVSIANKPHFDVNKRFDMMETLVKMIAKGSQKSMFICGDGGLGKTKTVLDTLHNEGMEEDIDFTVIKGSSTAKGLFCKLRDNADSVLVFDDCDDVFKNPQASNLLKAATDSYDKRIVSWEKDSASAEEAEANKFEFTGRIIFISNLPVALFPQALISRSTVVDLGMTTDEKIERIEHVIEKLTVATMVERMAALDVLKDNRDRIKDINFRTVIKFAGFFEDLGVTEEAKELCLFTAC